jgi:hypothetical protein
MIAQAAYEIEEILAPSWDIVDRALRSIAGRRAAIDAEEARWLREAELVQIWRPLGMVSIFDYMERVLGHSPHNAKERLRVARALGDLHATAKALEHGALSHSAVRELTRVATAETEDEWIEAARGKNNRQIEDLVAGHRKGDRPNDPGDPEVRDRVVRLELRPETYAALRKARVVLETEHGGRLDDNAFIAALAGIVLGGERPEARAQHQLSVTVCERCHKGWQEGAGAKLPISAAAVDRAECDAEHIGSIDADVPTRAVQDVPPSVARLVWARDASKCSVPGCRSSRGLEIHHIVRRADEGTHELSNLILICSSCHIAHHDGRLTIRGTAGAIEVQRSHVGLNVSTTRVQAKDALVQLGWKARVATGAVDAAIADLGDAPIEQVIRAALQRCWQPSA